MNTFSKKYIVPIKFLPWIFWAFISLLSLYLYNTAWIR